jgi:hypothetical protein
MVDFMRLTSGSPFPINVFSDFMVLLSLVFVFVFSDYDLRRLYGLMMRVVSSISDAAWPGKTRQKSSSAGTEWLTPEPCDAGGRPR